MADRYPDAGLRVTAAQRDRAAAELREAAADERLSFDELEARLPTVLGAKTRGDLVAVLRDLVPAAEMGAVVGADAPTGHGIGFEWEHPWVIETRWDTVRQIGEWVLPPFMELVSGGGTIILNAIHASAFAPVTDIVLTGKGGVRIVVPEGWGVDTEGVKVDNGQTAGLNSKRPHPAGARHASPDPARQLRGLGRRPASALGGPQGAHEVGAARPPRARLGPPTGAGRLGTCLTRTCPRTGCGQGIRSATTCSWPCSAPTRPAAWISTRCTSARIRR